MRWGERMKHTLSGIKKYTQWIRMGIKSQTFYRGIITDRLLGFIVQFVLMYFFWKAVYGKQNILNGRTFSEMFLYLVFSTSIFALYLYPSLSFLADDIVSGNIVTLLIKPIDYQLQYICKQFGIVLFMSAILAPVLLVSCAVIGFIPQAVNFILFLLALLLGFLFITSFDFFVGTFCFWTENNWGLTSIEGILFEFFSGALIPLDFFPAGIQKFVAEILPFGKVVYTPIQILQGKYPLANLWMDYLLLLFWTLLCLAMGRVLLNKAYGCLISNGG